MLATSFWTTIPRLLVSSVGCHIVCQTRYALGMILNYVGTQVPFFIGCGFAFLAAVAGVRRRALGSGHDP